MELVAHGSQQLHNKGVSHLHAHGLIDCMHAATATVHAVNQATRSTLHVLNNKRAA